MELGMAVKIKEFTEDEKRLLTVHNQLDVEIYLGKLLEICQVDSDGWVKVRPVDDPNHHSVYLEPFLLEPAPHARQVGKDY